MIQLSVRQRGPVAALRRGLRPRRRRRPASPPTASGSATATPSSRLLDATFADIPHAELLARLAEVGIPAGEVRTLDRVYDWDQTRSQGLVVDVDHPLLGTIELPGPPLRFDDNAFAGGRSEHLHPPLLGEHDECVRAWLDELDGAAGEQRRGDVAERHPWLGRPDNAAWGDACS